MYIYQSDVSRDLTSISVRYTLGCMKRRKPKSERKEATILIRLTDEQKTVLANAAREAGLDLSGWVRSLALRAAADLAART